MPSRGSTGSRTWLPLFLAVSLAAGLVAPAAAEPDSDEVRARISVAQDRLDDLEITVGRVVDEYNDAQEALDTIESEHAATKAEHLTLTADVGHLQDALQDHFRRLYKLGPAMELSSVVVGGDPTETTARLTAMRRILDGQRIDLETFDALRVAVAATEERLAEQRDEADAKALLLEERRIEVQATIAATQDEIDRHNRDLRAAISREEAAARAEDARRRRIAAEEARQRRLTDQATRTSTGSPSTSENRAPSPPSTPPRGNAQVAVDAALSKLGRPYRWGATGPNAFDCSGLMVWAWAQAGVTLPRTSSGQFAGLRRISRDELRPGDLVFAGSPSVHHVGMYIGDGQIVHSPYTGAVVSIRSMNRPDIRGYGRPG